MSRGHSQTQVVALNGLNVNPAGWQCGLAHKRQVKFATVDALERFFVVGLVQHQADVRVLMLILPNDAWQKAKSHRTDESNVDLA